jgi:hypothetical protein
VEGLLAGSGRRFGTRSHGRGFALVRTRDHCERGGRSFSVHAYSPHVARLLRTLGLDDLLIDNEDRAQRVPGTSCSRLTALVA